MDKNTPCDIQRRPLGHEVDVGMVYYYIFEVFFDEVKMFFE